MLGRPTHLLFVSAAAAGSAGIFGWHEQRTEFKPSRHLAHCLHFACRKVEQVSDEADFLRQSLDRFGGRCVRSLKYDNTAAMQSCCHNPGISRNGGISTAGNAEHVAEQTNTCT
jgi:hypothetical protein